MELVQIIINNAKVLGIFVGISLISMPVLGLIGENSENKINPALMGIIAIMLTVFMLTLYFFAGRIWLKSTGVLIHDCLSIIFVLVIVSIILILKTEVILFFAYPHLCVIDTFNLQQRGIFLLEVMSAIAILIGVLTKNGIDVSGK